MPRIFYNLMTQGGVAGGVKVTLRHVEALRDLGFDAVCYMPPGSVPPAWIEHTAPIEVSPPVGPDDIVVLADDAVRGLMNMLRTDIRIVLLAQNPYLFAAISFETLNAYPDHRFPTIMAVSQPLAATIARAYPQARLEIVPCFADERLFGPAPGKGFAVAYSPRKRQVEGLAIPQLFRRIHPRHASLEWTELSGRTEREVAGAFAASALHLSLSRLESVGMTTLEAMASGCVCAGFPGVGGRIYMTPENGFWAPDEDCEAAADALAEAADLVRTGGPRFAAMVEAGQETARAWSYARFREALEQAWMRIAPQMRKSNGPLPYAAP
jgi:hypothetical protein